MSAATWLIIAIVGFSLAGILFVIAVFMFIKLNVISIIGDLTGKTAAKQIEEIRKINLETGNKHYRPDAFNIERGTLTEPVTNTISKRLSRIQEQKVAHPSKRLDAKGITGKTSNVVSTEGNFENKYSKTSKNIFNNTVEQDGNGPTDILQKEGKTGSLTEVISDESEAINQTEVLSDESEAINQTEVLSDESEAIKQTEVLSDESEAINQTEVLSDESEVSNPTDIISEETQEQSENNLTTVLSSNDGENAKQVMEQSDFKIIKNIIIIHTDEVI